MAHSKLHHIIHLGLLEQGMTRVLRLAHLIDMLDVYEECRIWAPIVSQHIVDTRDKYGDYLIPEGTLEKMTQRIIYTYLNHDMAQKEKRGDIPLEALNSIQDSEQQTNKYLGKFSCLLALYVVMYSVPSLYKENVLEPLIEKLEKT